jgi:hypothetical protein
MTELGTFPTFNVTEVASQMKVKEGLFCLEYEVEYILYSKVDEKTRSRMSPKREAGASVGQRRPTVPSIFSFHTCQAEEGGRPRDHQKETTSITLSRHFALLPDQNPASCPKGVKSVDHSLHAKQKAVDCTCNLTLDSTKTDAFCQEPCWR